MQKIVYKYIPQTGEYAGAHSCQKNPVRGGAFLVPQHTTDIEPPHVDDGFVAIFNGASWDVVQDDRGKEVYCINTKNMLGAVNDIGFELSEEQTFLKPPEPDDGKAVKWNGDAWEQIPDYRGETVYSTITGEEIVIDEIGDYPENTTKIPRPDGYHVWNGEAWEFDNQYLWDVVRGQRDGLLTACDWMMVPDAPTDKSAWQAYRQALRDLPENQADAETLDDIVWPEPPTA